MVYREEIRDLFSVSENYFLAHCISGDYALGAGIAVEFNKRFDMRRKLMMDFPDYWNYMEKNKLTGGCILIDNVLNLITKKKYYHKPTYQSMLEAITMMKVACKANNIKRVAMPQIGCGLDQLEWDKVSKIILDVFSGTNIEILVCKLEKEN